VPRPKAADEGRGNGDVSSLEDDVPVAVASSTTLPVALRGLRYTDAVKLSTLCLAGALLASSHAGAADRLFINGLVHTPEGTLRESILVRDGRIVSLSPAGEAAGQPPAGTEVIDLAGAHVLPGLMDAHLHLTGYGTSLELVDLSGARSWDEVVDRVVRFARDRPPGEWILGRGWDQNLWPGHAFPDRKELDRALPKRAVLLQRVDGHAAVANARALELAGIDRTTKDPAGGRILRRKDGVPTGVLVDNAVDLARKVVPAPDAAVIERRILGACDALARFGLTQVDDAGTTAAELAVLRKLAAADRLPIRVYVLLNGSDQELLARELAQPPTRGGPAMLRIGGVKLYADGALGSRGALLGADYSDDPGNRGLAVMGVEELDAAVRRAAADPCHRRRGRPPRAERLREPRSPPQRAAAAPHRALPDRAPQRRSAVCGEPGHRVDSADPLHLGHALGAGPPRTEAHRLGLPVAVAARRRCRARGWLGRAGGEPGSEAGTVCGGHPPATRRHACGWLEPR